MAGVPAGGGASDKLFKSPGDFGGEDAAWPSLLGDDEVRHPPLSVHHGGFNLKKVSRSLRRVCCCACASSRDSVGGGKVPSVGALHVGDGIATDDHGCTLGRFAFEWKSGGGGVGGKPTFSIRSLDTTDTSRGEGSSSASTASRHRPPPLWSSVPGGSFVGGAAVSLDVYEERGSIDIVEKAEKVFANQSVDGIEFDEGGRMFTISGRLSSDGDAFGDSSPRYALTFSVGRRNDRAIAFQLEIAGGDGGDGIIINQAHLVGASDADEAIFGFGEQFTHVNCKGYQVHVLAEEGGIGRGDEGNPRILRFLGVEGEPSSSYCPSPHMTCRGGRSLFLTNAEPSVFDLRPDDRFHVRVNSSRMRGCLLDGRDPLDAVELFTEFAGRMPPLPEWVHRGAIVGMQGGTDRVRRVWSDLKRRGVPVAGFWLQDWVGQRETVIGKQLWWNWVLDEDRYPGWADLVRDLEREGIAVGVYVNPFLVDVPSAQLNGRRNLYKEAVEGGYVVKNTSGRVYSVPNTDFSAAVLDLSNDRTRRWFVDVLRTEVLGRAGVKFWMADFGEAAPFDGVYESGESGLTYHNKYPVEWARLNRAAIKDAGKDGEDAWFFARAGFLDTPSHATAMWLGDQNVTWGERDGLPSAIDGMVSGGFSGLSINHSDIGGYTSVSNPFLRRCLGRGFVRSRELFERWMEVNAFTSIFRTHEGNEPDENVQFYTDDESLEAFARWSKVYAALGEYRKGLMKEASDRGWPVVRHPVMHYPKDDHLLDPRKVGHSFMMGHLVYVSPVVKPGVTKMRVYLPEGRWVHLWTKKTFGSGGNPSGGGQGEGVSVDVAVPLGQPAVFYAECNDGTRLVADKVKEIGVFSAS